MKKTYIIAEAAQGFEGNVDVSKLLVRAAAKAGADAIKFQLVFADDLAEPGYEYYELFKTLQMTYEEWRAVRDLAKDLKVDMIFDIFGPQSLAMAKSLSPDGIKIHSTCFFDDRFINEVLTLDTAIYLSIGGIHQHEVERSLERYGFRNHPRFVLMYGYQAEPTPIEANNLSRIPQLRKTLAVENIGFMDHSDGDGDFTITLSAVALGLGVNVFEKHITLDRQLEMEDYISALGPRAFAAYVKQIRELSTALGSDSLELNEAEQKYRGRAIKRVVATSDLAVGDVLDLEHVKLSRSSNMAGSFLIEDVLGRKLVKPTKKGEGIEKDMVA